MSAQRGREELGAAITVATLSKLQTINWEVDGERKTRSWNEYGSRGEVGLWKGWIRYLSALPPSLPRRVVVATFTASFHAAVTDCLALGLSSSSARPSLWRCVAPLPPSVYAECYMENLAVTATAVPPVQPQPQAPWRFADGMTWSRVTSNKYV